MAGALVRELDEELGIRIEPPEQPPWETVQADGVELNVFIIDRWEGDPRNAATDEHDDMRRVGSRDIA
jgi:8-oxo-dGTP pyrophosphatase MutT (NUDIX family)